MSFIDLGFLLLLGLVVISGEEINQRHRRQFPGWDTGNAKPWESWGSFPTIRPLEPGSRPTKRPGMGWTMPDFGSWSRPTWLPFTMPDFGSIWTRPTRVPWRPIRTTTEAAEPEPWTTPEIDPEPLPEDPEVPVSEMECGVQSAGFEPQLGRKTKVINGREAKPNSWPWVVAFLGGGGGGKVMCGGSLLRAKDGVESTDIVLTAAHCVTQMRTISSSPRPVQASSLTIAAGRHRYNQKTKYTQESRGQKVLIHPEFRMQGGTVVNDIALVKLAAPIRFSEGVRPVCVPAQDAPIPTKLTCVAAGWGRNNSHSMFMSPEALQQVIAPAHPASTCTRGWGNMYKEKSMVCAGDLAGKSGVCNGDSGSTLMCKDGNRWVQHGVVSFGVPGECLEQNKPDVYARVSSYADWIKESIQQMTSL